MGVARMINLEEIKPQYLTNDSGEKTAVVIAMADFQALLEDIEDLAAVAERREEPSVSHEAFKAELERDGFL